jgi:hypothetical protein
MHSRGTTWMTLALIAGALAVRFHRLGDWPFAFDEVPTLEEVQTLADPSSAAPESQAFRLPRLIPVGYLFSWAGIRLFGADEFGSRVVPALLGAAMVGLVFGIGRLSLGRGTALAAALLTALWPAHVFQSQQNRFYMAAALFASVTMLCGSVAAARPRLRWIVLACAAATLSVLSHTVTAVLLPAVGLGVLAARYAEGRSPSRSELLAFSAGAAVIGLLFLVYLLPLASGWNRNAAWGYSVGHSVLASVNMLGWPVALLAGLGLVLMHQERKSQAVYWLACLGAWGGITLVLPLRGAYHAWYAFPFASCGLVLAAFAVSTISERLARIRPAAGVLWVCAACMLNLPSLASHFVDGSRPDMRTAARYVAERCTTGDRVATIRAATFRYYAPGCAGVQGLPASGNVRAALERLARGDSRVWIVVDSTRGGLPGDVHQWLLAHASHALHVQRTRFDYFEYTVDVFRFDPGRARER